MVSIFFFPPIFKQILQYIDTQPYIVYGPKCYRIGASSELAPLQATGGAAPQRT